MNKENTGEIVVYQPDEVTRLEVRVEGETVWLNRHQLAALFDRDVKTIGKHIKNALREELRNLATVANFATVQKEGSRFVERSVEYYNLDMIISIGYRVKSERGVLFRSWANAVLKEYLLRGYAVNKRIEVIEDYIRMHERRLDEYGEKIDFFVRTSLPPMEGVFYDGQIFDAYVFASDLIRLAQRRVVLIDNYVDESVLVLLSKRGAGVSAEIRTGRLPQQFQLDLDKHNSQYPPVVVVQTQNIHDRFLIVDDTVYHIGASLKDLGKKLFAFSRMGISPEMLIR
ncbi:MAG: DNA-binding protein [Bacteroidales bacterium]|nr:DNA-binding protein [Bacteroidales bacterium]